MPLVLPQGQKIAVSLGVAVSAQERALRKSSAAAAEPFDIVVGMPGSQTQLVLTSVYLQPAALELVPGSVLQHLHDTPGVGYAAPAFGDYLGSSPIVGSTSALLTLGGTRPLAEGRPFDWDLAAGARGVQLASLALRSSAEGRRIDVPRLAVC